MACPVSWPKLIENIWLKIKRTLETRAEFINTKQQLMAEIQTAWENIPTAYTEELYGRLIEVLKINGNLTKYWGKIGI